MAFHSEWRLVAEHGRRFCDQAGRALDLWHLCSLDAPTVSVVWLLFVSRCARVHLGRCTPIAMFLAVWMLYAGDRLLDARFLGSPSPAAAREAELEQRHRFHYRHRAWFERLLVGSGAGLAGLAWRLPRTILKDEAGLGAVLLLWLTVIHVSAELSVPRRLPKELLVGLFFAAAVTLPTLAQTGVEIPAQAGVQAHSTLATLWPGVLLFACVCTLNCLFLYAWEHPFDRSKAHGATRWAADRVVPLTGFVLLGACLVPACGSTRGATAMAAACALSTALLLLLHQTRRRYARLRLRALADLALLTPVLFRLSDGWR